MSVTFLAPPALEPISLGEAKDHLRIEHTAEDTLLRSYIASARLHIEAHLAMLLIEQSWRINFDTLPIGKTIELPLAPLMSLDAVSYYPAQSGPIGIPTVDYTVDLDASRPRFSLKLARQNLREFGAYELEVTAGFGSDAEDVPADVRQALLMLVAYWYENREAATAIVRENMPHGVRAILEPHRRVQL